ncbi:MAG: Translation initiation factor IF-3 [Microgenomates group bacterium GW2011_GWC2_46_7]|nr:MAG: Translation initiation factor IF-3 [Microgenomates group bacterium GW2011_GWC2_46_7]
MKFYAVNQFIKATEMRVVDDTGKQIGVMTKAEALRIAGEKGVDLVEIAPMAKPPVCKVIDFKKFKYLEAKKDREGKAASGKVEIKEIRFSPFIALGDMNSRLERIKDILSGGDRVKIVVKFTGRQITRVEFGHDLIKKILVSLEGIATADGVAKLQGKQLFLIINPTKKKA